jgi:hypothetical protein
VAAIIMNDTTENVVQLAKAVVDAAMDDIDTTTTSDVRVVELAKEVVLETCAMEACAVEDEAAKRPLAALSDAAEVPEAKR